MCGNYRDDNLANAYHFETSNQLPDPIRLNSIVRQSDLFNEAFQCPRLDRTRSCFLWN